MLFPRQSVQACLDDGRDAVIRLADSRMHTVKLKIHLEQIELLVWQCGVIVIGNKTAQQIGECEIDPLGPIAES